MSKKHPHKINAWIEVEENGYVGIRFVDGLIGSGGGDAWCLSKEELEVLHSLPEEIQKHLIRMMNRIIKADLEILMLSEWQNLNDEMCQKDPEYKEFEYSERFDVIIFAFFDEWSCHFSILLNEVNKRFNPTKK